MSNAAIHWAWQQSTGNTASKLILHVLADLADEVHACWPSIEHIMAKTEISKSTVLRRLGDLEAAGLIRRERRAVGFGKRRSNMYVLDVDGQVSKERASLGVNMTPSGEQVEKPQISTQGVILTLSDVETPTLSVSCDTYIETPQEMIDIHLSSDAEARDDSQSQIEVDTAEVDAELRELHPSLTVASITARLNDVDMAQVDIVWATRVLLERSGKRKIHSYPAYIASGIRRSPQAWPKQHDPVKLSPSWSARDAERQDRDACERGIHDWGPASWRELDRAWCTRNFCDVRRIDVDSEYAASSLQGAAQGVNS